MTYETRFDSAAGFAEVRSEGKRMILSGYAALFEKRSKPLGSTGFGETVNRSAFNRTLANGSDVLALVSHDPKMVLGRTGGKTLELRADEKGLAYAIELDESVSLHRDIARQVERRDFPGSSFGFRAIRDKWSVDDDGAPRRELLEVHLRDVGPTSMPAYDTSSATVAIRSLAEATGIEARDLASATSAELADAIVQLSGEESAGATVPRKYHHRKVI